MCDGDFVVALCMKGYVLEVVGLKKFVNKSSNGWSSGADSFGICRLVVVA